MALRNSSGGGDRFGCAPLCPSLHTRSYVSNTRLCVCGSGRVPRFLNVMFLGLFCFARSAANLREAHLGWYLNGCFHLSGRAQRQGTPLNKGNKTNTHFSKGNMLTVSARTFLCALIALKLLKRCPPGAVIGLDNPPKVRRKQ